jgi:hypothetical protein
MRKEEERFLSKIKKTQNCWEWIASLDTGGYGSFWSKNKNVLAHRYSYEFFNKIKIPSGRGYHGTCVLHTCDNPKCVNPNHLKLGSHSDNLLDCSKKGRIRDSRGEKNGRNKLCNEDVIFIRKNFIKGLNKSSRGNAKDLAKKYDVDFTLIHLIVKRKIWSHI